MLKLHDVLFVGDSSKAFIRPFESEGKNYILYCHIMLRVPYALLALVSLR